MYISTFAPLKASIHRCLSPLYHTGADSLFSSFSIMGDGRIADDSGDFFFRSIRRISVITPRIPDF